MRYCISDNLYFFQDVFTYEVSFSLTISLVLLQVYPLLRNQYRVVNSRV